MGEMNRRLHETIMIAAYSLEKEYNVCGVGVCFNLSYVGAQLIKDAGFEPYLIWAKVEALGVSGEKDLTGHAWIRVDGWNVDFAIGQFPEASGFPYPWITWPDDPMALEIYGPGSSDLDPELYEKSQPSAWIFYARLESVIRPDTIKGFQVLRHLERTIDILPYYRTVQLFRRTMKREGLMDKPIPGLRLPKTLPMMSDKEFRKEI